MQRQTSRKKMKEMLNMQNEISKNLAETEIHEKLEATERILEKETTETGRFSQIYEKFKHDKQILYDAEKESSMVSILSQCGLLANDEIMVDDGDQKTVKGDEATRLKCLWASGMDWEPRSPTSSNWMKILAFGKYKEVSKMLKETPVDQIKVLLERRETSLNFSAIFHVIKGAIFCWSPELGAFIQYGNRMDDCYKYEDVLNKLIEYGANIEAKDFAGFTPLFYCLTRYCNPTTIRLAGILLNNGANVNAQNRLGETPLAEPTMCRNFENLKLLLDHGANPTIRDYNGCSAETSNLHDSELKKVFVEARRSKSKAMRKAEKEEPGGSLKCSLCSKPSTSRCTACYARRYCSRECQKAHWKVHKKECKEIQNKYQQFTLTYPQENEVNISYGKEVKLKRVGRKIIPVTKDFVAKIQIPLNDTGVKIFSDITRIKIGEGLIFYNEDKSVYGYIATEEGVYKPLVEKIRKEGVYGDKGFFYILVDKDGNLKVNSNEILAPRKW